MNFKQIAGILLVAPIVLIVLSFVGVMIYSYFVFYPLPMTALTIFISAAIGVALLKDGGK
jgi:hypothetical protein